MEYQYISYEVEEKIACLTANRPKYRNAQSRKLLEEMDHAFKTAGEDRDVNIIVLLGAGDHFSGGHDLGSTDEAVDREERPRQAGLRGRFDHSREHFVEKSLRWRNVPKPTIASVQGYCIFAGWMIASAMDIIFAADNAMFLGSNFQYFSLPWDIQDRKVKEILFESRFIDAREALELGAINRVVPEAQLRDEVMDYAGRVARNDPFQLRMIKLAVNQRQDGMGFTNHITSSHAMHILSSEGEKDPDYALKVPKGKRRPMVQRAFENYELYKQTRDD